MRCGHAQLIRHSGAIRFLRTLPVRAPYDLQWNAAISGKEVALAGNYSRIMRNVVFDTDQMHDRGHLYWSVPPLVFQWPPGDVRTVAPDENRTEPTDPRAEPANEKAIRAAKQRHQRKYDEFIGEDDEL